MVVINTKKLVVGSLLSSDAGIPPPVMKDVLDSLLFFQLYADTKVSRFDPSAAWFEYFDQAVLKLKWTTSDYEGDVGPPQSDLCISISVLVEKVLSKYLASKQVEEVKEMMTCIGSLAEDNQASLLFRQQTVKASAEVPGRTDVFLQIDLLDPGLRLSSLFVIFGTTSEVGHDLWHQTFPEASLVDDVQVRFRQREWNHADNKHLVGKIQAFLADKREGMILPISCEASEEASDD
ncbi:hypothetical protein AFK24_03085 [Pseudomonas syringae]|uniref:Uncharacterized protein n=1 Tax=Pseudomonas syringae TaxID=317 RepID=A0A1C7ZAY9_PSESX|nr:hypothetical protein [Pseudomonas syringae]OCR26529.1 hypothetical protein AFK24_03085 [Pseudomonas syringae]